MSCQLCSADRDFEGADSELLGEFCFDEEFSLDHFSSGRLALWHDEEGYCITVLIDNTHSNGVQRAVNKLPSIACLPVKVCPLCGRELV